MYTVEYVEASARLFRLGKITRDAMAVTAMVSPLLHCGYRFLKSNVGGAEYSQRSLADIRVLIQLKTDRLT